MATSAKTTEKDIFKTDSPGVLAQRIIYKNYIQPYIAIMMSKFRKVTIFHAFSGMEKNSNHGWPTEIEKYGPPIISLRVALHYFKRKGNEDIVYDNDRQIDVDAYLNEIDELKKSERSEIEIDTSPNHRMFLIYAEGNSYLYKELLKNVIKVIKMYRLRCEVEQDFKNGICKVWCDFRGTNRGSSSYVVACYLVHADFAQMAVPREPCLTFIDPVEYTGAPIDRVKKFVGLKMEVIVNLRCGYLNRCKSSRSVGREALTLQKTMAALYGLTLDDIASNSERKEDLTTTDIVSNVFHSYEQTLKRETGTDLTLSFEIRKENQFCDSCLLFATTHMKGFIYMKESMIKASPDSKSFWLSEENDLGSITIDQDNDDIARTIHKHFSGKEVLLSEVKNYVWLKTPFLFRKTPLKLLEMQGQLTVKTRDVTRKRGTFPDRRDWELVFTSYPLP